MGRRIPVFMINTLNAACHHERDLATYFLIQVIPPGKRHEKDLLIIEAAAGADFLRTGPV
jgi:hypothetical protein